METVQCLEVNSARRFWKMDEDKAVCSLKGKDIVIAILDTGIQRDHKAFKDIIILQHSWNVLSNNDNIKDEDGHGTQCAGVAVGNQFKPTGSHTPSDQATFQGGVAPEARLIVYKVGEHKDKSSFAAIMCALQRIHKLNDQEGIHVDVVSMSFAFRNNPPRELQQVISAITDQGTICVACAGNYGFQYERPITGPASCQNVIAVGAHNRQGKQINLSSDDRKVCCTALGKNVCAPTIGDNEALDKPDGTSLAAPAVAGLIALLIPRMRELGIEVNFNCINRVLERIVESTLNNTDLVLHPKTYMLGLLGDNGKEYHESFVGFS